MAWSSIFLVALVLTMGAVSFLGFTGHRRKTDRDIEDRLAAIERLVGELTGDDLSRPPRREVRIKGEPVPQRPSALHPRA